MRHFEDVERWVKKNIEECEREMEKIKKITIGVMGKVSVGKSTLINSLFKVEKAEVSAIPGTTKEVKYYEFEKDMAIVDTPGLEDMNVRNSAEARKVIKNMDAVVYLFAGASITGEEIKAYLEIKRNIKHVIPVLNKMDTVPEKERKKLRKWLEDRIKSKVIDASLKPVYGKPYGLDRIERKLHTALKNKEIRFAPYLRMEKERKMLGEDIVLEFTHNAPPDIFQKDEIFFKYITRLSYWIGKVYGLSPEVNKLRERLKKDGEKAMEDAKPLEFSPVLFFTGSVWWVLFLTVHVYKKLSQKSVLISHIYGTGMELLHSITKSRRFSRKSAERYSEIYFSSTGWLKNKDVEELLLALSKERPRLFLWGELVSPDDPDGRFHVLCAFTTKNIHFKRTGVIRDSVHFPIPRDEIEKIKFGERNITVIHKGNEYVYWLDYGSLSLYSRHKKYLKWKYGIL